MMSPLRRIGSATTGVPVGTAPRVFGPVLGDLAGELVAEDHGLVRAREAVIARAHGQLGPLVRAGAGVEIGAADPTPHDA